MKLSADSLVSALLVCSGGSASDPAEIVALARATQPSFVPSLFSAWENEGHPVSPALAEEISACRSRLDFYRSVASSVLSEFDGLSTIKGFEVADLYPSGVLRYMNDLDFVAANETDLWQAAAFLIAQEWELDTATFVFLGGELHMVVSLRKPHEDRYQHPYGVELTTWFALGDLRGIPPITRMPAPSRVPSVKNMLMLLNERYEQPFRARDLVDAALLHESLCDKDFYVLFSAISAYNLAPEYGELAGLIRASELGELTPLPGGWRAMAQARAARLARGAEFLSRPVLGAARHLQRRLVTGAASRAESLAWAAIAPRLSTVAAVRAGLLAFGLPLRCPRAGMTRSVLHAEGDLMWMDTPVDRFLLTVGDEVKEAAIEALSGDSFPRE